MWGQESGWCSQEVTQPVMCQNICKDWQSKPDFQGWKLASFTQHLDKRWVMALQQKPWLLSTPEHGGFLYLGDNLHCNTWTWGMEKPWRCSSTAFCKHVPEVSTSFLRNTQTSAGPKSSSFKEHLFTLGGSVSTRGGIDSAQPNCTPPHTIQWRGNSVIWSSKASWSA